MTHPTCPSEAPNSSRMLGTATLTIELFNTDTKTAAIKTANNNWVEPPDRSSSVPPLSGGFTSLLYLLGHGL